MKKLLLLLLTLSHSATASVQINSTDYFSPERLGDVQLYHGKKGFTVLKDGHEYHVASYDVDKTVRNMTTEQLEVFLGHVVCLSQKEVTEMNLVEIEITQDEYDNLVQRMTSGYLVLGQLSNGDYTITAKTRLLGGGFLGAMWGASFGRLLVQMTGKMVIASVSNVISLVSNNSRRSVEAGITAMTARPLKVASDIGAFTCGVVIGFVTGPV